MGERELSLPVPGVEALKFRGKGEALSNNLVDRKGIEEQRKQARILVRQQQAAERIAAAAEELSSGVHEASRFMGELRFAVEEIAGRAEEISSATEEATATINQVARSVQQITAECSDALGFVKNVQQKMKENQGVLETIAREVGVAAARSEESARNVGELQQQAGNIGEIVRTVVRIADQTNLLALNAAIEAARAGEHGKGFAVVADEVRTLAETSEKAANDIRDLISAILEQADKVTADIARAAEGMRPQIEKSQAIGEGMAKGALAIGEVVVSGEKAAELSRQSTESIGLFLQMFTEEAVAADEQASSAQEALRSVEQQVSAMAEVKALAGELAEMAEEHRGVTDVYKHAESLAAAAERLSSSFEESARSAQEIVTALNLIAEGSQSQAKTTEESILVAGKIKNMVQAIAEGSSGAFENCKQRSEILVRNLSIIEDLHSALSLVRETNLENVRRIRDLDALVGRINKIVEAIVTVGIQTNMLAVSGAIEAARAGEYGKGFAVVAADIRSLARDSGSNADQIKDLVKSIQDQIGVVLRDVVAVGEMIGHQVEMTWSTVDRAHDYAEDLRKAMAHAKSNTELVEEIMAAMLQCEKAVDQIAQAARDTAAACEQAASSSKEQAHGMKELSLEIEELTALADEMQQA